MNPNSPLLDDDLLALLMADEEAAPSFASGSIDLGPVPLSYAQQRLWFLQRFAPESSAYNLPRALELIGELDAEVLEQALNKVIDRHDILRTRFEELDGVPMQRVDHQARLNLARIDFSGLDAASQNLDQRIAEEASRPFDLSQAPLIRGTLLKLSAQRHVLLLTLHHIGSDAWSNPILIRDLGMAYALASQGDDTPLPRPEAQYADYAQWQRKVYLSSELKAASGEYWQHRLGGEITPLALPTDRPRLANQAHPAAYHHLVLPGDLVQGIERLCSEHRLTPMVVLLGAWQLLLARYSGQADFTVGLPNATRNQAETQELVGLFVTSQIIRAQVQPDQPVLDYLRDLRQQTLAALEHADYPFELILEELQLNRSQQANPAFQTMFNWSVVQDGPAGELRLGELEVRFLESALSEAKFDISLDVAYSPQQVGASFQYSAALYDAATLARMGQHWVNLLRGLVAQPQWPVGELAMLSVEEAGRTLRGLNATEQAWADEAPVQVLFERQVLERPEQVALLFGDSVLSYAQLNVRANQLAHQLIQLGVGPEVIVGIAAERSTEMVIGLMAILKAGGAYVPLDPEYPQDRLSYMFEDSGIDLLLTQEPLLAGLPAFAGRTLLLESDFSRFSSENPEIAVGAENLAYVIYTSGSTGKPKGAGNRHTALHNRLAWMQSAYPLDSSDTVLQKTPFSFDVSVWEFFWPLMTGARLAIAAPGEHREPEKLIATIQRHSVTTLHFVPSMLQVFIHEPGVEQCVSLKQIMCSGEALQVDAQQQVFARLPQAGLYNLYGPTEAAIDVTHWTCCDEGVDTVPIGEPIANLYTHILDASLGPVPQGATGELVLGGLGLARGYHRRPALTAERFIPDPHAEVPGSRLYRTGDLAKYRETGVIEYQGRIDHQVKIRGLRIELGEIEARLLEQDAVKEAVVLAVEGVGGLQLVAYIVPVDYSDTAEDQAALRDALKAELKTHLPDYMVPAQMLCLAQLPVTPNGKLDRRALPAPNASQLQSEYIAPQSDLEQRIAQIWQDVLRREQVGITDNFFELGGDSIISIQVVSRARQAGIRFTPKELFEHQTVQGLAKVARIGGEALAIDQGPVMGETPLLPFQQVFFDTEIPERHHWNQSVLLKTSVKLGARLVEQALEALAQHHDALRLVFDNQAATFAATAPNVFWHRAVTDTAALEALCQKAQASLSLETGPLLRAVLADLPDGSQRLLLVIHHLAVDGVSWRVLLEDLQTACTQLQNGQAVQLPAKTSSVKAWALKLQGYAQSDKLQAELGYWKRLLAGVAAELPVDNALGGLQRCHAGHANTHLPRELTQKLLQQAPAAYRTQVNDLLLTALARVISRWTGHAETLVQMEGHGREDLFDDIDLTRSVGWFTSLYPVRLTATEDLAGALKQIKEQLRAIPDKGIGFGALRYLGSEEVRNQLAALPVPRITFNYLGQFDGSFASDTTETLFSPAAENRGAEQSEQAPLQNWLSINGQVYNGELNLGWTFSREMFEEATIEQLADDYAAELQALVEHCCDEHNAGTTPSDFPLTHIDQAQLDRLPVAAREVDDLYPLAPMQQGMLFHTLLDHGGGDYINQLRLDVRGLEVERFRAAWQATLDAHDILRTAFLHGGELEQPVQVVYKHAVLPFGSHHWEARQDAADALDTLAESERHKGFDLAQAPLMRLVLVHTAPHHLHLIYTSHHILMDGWSTSQLLGEVLQRYSGQAPASASGRYRDYIAWLQRQDVDAAQAFWQEQLATLDEPTLLAGALAHDGNGESGYADHAQILDETLTARLGEFARRQKVTANTLIQAAWLLLLQRCTGQSTVAFGATVAGRPAELKGVERQIGLFINTLPVVASPRAEQELGQWLQEVQAQNLALREHEHSPLFDIQRWAGRAGEALFDTLVVFENYPVSEALEQGAPGELAFGRVSSQEQTNYPLTLIAHLGELLELRFNYDRSHYQAATVSMLAEHLMQVLVSMVESPANQCVGELDMLGTGRQALLRGWNATQLAWADEWPVHRLFEQQVLAQPEQVALLFGDSVLSYAQLNVRANQLAHQLIALGVGPEVIVGIAAERSLEMVIGLMAILKAGGAYVPLDPEYPQDRLSYMFEDSGIDLLLTQEHLLDGLPTFAGRTLLLESDFSHFSSDNPDVPVVAENLAYVIYTSGSTGKPKGAGNRHTALHNRLAWMQSAYPLDASDTVLQKTPFSFDVSVWEFFWPLMTGARLAIAAPGEHREPGSLIATIQRHGVTTLHFVPSMLQVFIHEPGVEQCISLKQIMCSGEALQVDAQQQVFARLPHAGLYNLYGPTEAAIDVTHWTCRDEGVDTVPIGEPIANLYTHILDASLNPVPHGATGELVLGGLGLARGYHRRPALTAERFIPDPHAEVSGSRLYRTGDLARYRDTGVIEYQGRIDHQVKIRGLRIELGEIEARLLEQEAVKEAVVLAVEGVGGLQLVAYIVPAQYRDAAEDQAALRDTLKAELKTHLPDYMVPAQMLCLAQLPVTPNGKLDRRALPAPETTGSQATYIAPATELEKTVAQIWQEVLKAERVGMNDHFFELGGHSLLATQVVSRVRQILGIEVALQALFDHPQLGAFVAALDPTLIREVPAFVLADRSQPLPLSFAQQRQWILWQLEPHSAAYNIPAALMIKGALDVKALERSFNALIQRHESLRTTFTQHAGEPLQVIHANRVLAIEIEKANYDDAQVSTWVAHEIARPFDLEAGPLLRVRLLKRSADEHVLTLTLHHIVSDGWSTPILVDELVQLYAGFTQGQPAELPALPIQYADYAVWQRTWMDNGERDRQLAYWTQQLGGEQPMLDLPLDHPRPALQSYRGARVQVELSAQLGDRVKALATREGETPFMLLLAAYQTLLHRYSGLADIRVGVPIANRNYLETEGLIGFFVNTQVLRASFEAQMTARSLLEQVKRASLDAQRYQDLPFDQLVDALQPERSLSHTPLFQVMFNYQHERPASDAVQALQDLTFDTLPGDTRSAQFDLTLDVSEAEGGFTASFTYTSELFEQATVERMARHWLTLLEGLMTQPAQRVSELEMLSPDEYRQALNSWNRNALQYSSAQPVHALFEAQVAVQPDAIALIFEERALSYAELNTQANRLAHQLIAQGIGPEVLVGIAVERSLEMVVGILAVLKAGGGYVPLDPQYPQDRLQCMIEDSRVALLLTQSQLQAQLPIPAGLPVLLLDALLAADLPISNPDVAVAPQNLAYVMFTSGSTGRPKGVGINHLSLARHAHVSIDFFNLNGSDRVLQFSTFNFDGFVEQLYPALVCGASVVIRGPEIWDSETFYRHLIDDRITTVDLTTAYWYLITKDFAQHGPRDYGLLRQVHAGGEAMPPEGIAVWKQAGLEHVTLLNTYGPTEATVTVTALDCAPYVNGEKPIPAMMPIGDVLGGRSIYLVDPALQPTPQGVAGEILIGGELLARGYFGRAALTAERFVPDPFEGSGQRLYRTGDLARANASGTLEYVGRIDHQVKIRGFRIELGEIEAKLLADSRVGEVIVLARESANGLQLVAYVVPNMPYDEAELRDSLRAELKASLPDYMVPAHWLVLERLPLSPNGKLDRKALSSLAVAASPNHYQPPQTELEVKVAQLWAEVLGLETVGRHDNFFELGGHSLKALNAVSLIKQRAHASVTLQDFMMYPNLAQLCQKLEGSAATSLLAELNAPGASRTLFCVPPAGGSPYCYRALANALLSTWHVKGLIFPALVEPNAPMPGWQEMIERYTHAIMRDQPSGEYHLLGWSIGGPIAMGIAQRLEQSGKKVSFLGLLDPTPEAAGQADIDDVFAGSRKLNVHDVLEMFGLFFPAHAQAAHAWFEQYGPAELDERFKESFVEWATRHTPAQRNELVGLLQTTADGTDFALGKAVYAHLDRISQGVQYPRFEAVTHCWWSSITHSVQVLDQQHARVAQQNGGKQPRTSECLSIEHAEMVASPQWIASLKRALE